MSYKENTHVHVHTCMYLHRHEIPHAYMAILKPYQHSHSVE